MTDLIVIAVIAAIIGLTARYVYKEKKRGVKCIGCPAAQNGTCGGSCGCGCGSGNGGH